jgi:D-aspartate ligase
LTNPSRAEPGWPPAVIAGAWRTGVLGVRSLIRRGVRAYCFDHEKTFPGFKSAYARAFVCPNPDLDPQGWLSFLIDLAGRIGEKPGEKPVLIASADQYVTAIAQHAAALSAHYVLSPAAALQGLLATKETQYALAAEHGMPMPSTRFVTSEEEVTEFAASAAYPCLLKPIHFREWQQFPADHPLHYQKVAIAATSDELVAHWRLAAAANPRVIVQEIIEGPDTAKRVYVSCYDRRGERIGAAIFRELRCDPLGFGPATVTEPINDSEADVTCDGFLRSIGYSGVCEIEMKWDTRDGRIKLIEANPRLTGGGDAAPYAGLDTCWLHYLDLIGVSVAPVTTSSRDFRHVVLRSEVAAIAAYRRAGLLTWTDLFRSYKPPLAFFDLDSQDWRYSVETFYRMARSVVGVGVRSVYGAWRKRSKA